MKPLSSEKETGGSHLNYKRLIGVWMAMPNEIPFKFNDLEFIIIHFGYQTNSVINRWKFLKFFKEIDFSKIHFFFLKYNAKLTRR